ncbi:MAG TPA: zinc-ribbon domain-containing protein [Methanomassiliicoccales archaeon]|nr:zinc-ribbon domain-containing protein [Methanomassiliicoccales archaeon]
MEKKTGFKECPRCGLRNKPSAAQCDFCGWEFRDVSDEWISHVQVLEKLNKATESIVLDDEVSRRIESTIVRSPREAPPSVPATETATAPVPAKGENVVETEPRPEKWPERRVVTVPPPIPEEEREVKNFVETMIGEPVSAQAAAEVNVSASEIAPLTLSHPAPLREEVVEVYVPQVTFVSKYWKLLLAGGAGVYAVALGLYASSYLSVALGWGMAIVGALLITFGVSHIYDSRVEHKVPSEPMIGSMRHAGDEVVICPRCHEEVSEGDARCPSCGAAFSR